MKAVKRLFTVLVSAALVLVASSGLAFAGSVDPTVGFTPNTDPNLDCPYASSSNIGHHGGSWDGTVTTEAGTLTFSAPDPNPGGSGLP